MGRIQVNDLDGDGLYSILGVHQKATSLELRKVLAKTPFGSSSKACVGAQAVTGCQSTKHVMQAYRKLAKSRHPDRGGSAAEFSKLQQAFEVLADPKQREVYDAWARQTQFRYVPGVDAQVSTWPSTCYHMHSATAGSIPCKSVPKLAIYMYSHRAEKTFSWTSMRGLGFTATHKHSLL